MSFKSLKCILTGIKSISCKTLSFARLKKIQICNRLKGSFGWNCKKVFKKLYPVCFECWQFFIHLFDGRQTDYLVFVAIQMENLSFKMALLSIKFECCHLNINHEKFEARFLTTEFSFHSPNVHLQIWTQKRQKFKFWLSIKITQWLLWLLYS